MFFIFVLGSAMFILGAGCCSSSEDGELAVNFIALIDERSPIEERIIAVSRASVSDLWFSAENINCCRAR